MVKRKGSRQHIIYLVGDYLVQLAELLQQYIAKQHFTTIYIINMIKTVIELFRNQLTHHIYLFLCLLWYEILYILL
jgi:Ethanolamine utilization protein EutJ (predicted chaperonin)